MFGAACLDDPAMHQDVRDTTVVRRFATDDSFDGPDEWE